MLEEVKRELTKLRQVLGKVAYYSRGAYDGSFLYKKHDVVTYQGSSYVSLKETKGNPPTNEEYWMLLAKKGDKGDQGIQGVQGEVGPQGEKGDKGDKGDTYEVTDEDLESIASQITENANSNFNKNVTEKTNEFNTNVTNKTTDFNSNAINKTTSFNNNYDDKLEAFNNNVVEKTNEFNVNVTDKTTTFDTNATNKNNTFNTNAETKMNDYNSNADNKLTEYNDNATTKVEEFNTSVESIKKDISDNTSRIKRIEFDLFDSGEAEGEAINVKDSALAEAIRIESEAGWKQETTEGYQLIDFATPTGKPSTFEWDFENDILTINAKTATSYNSLGYNITNLIKFNHGKQLSFSAESIISSSSKTFICVQLNITSVDGRSIYIPLTNNKGYKYNYTIPEDTTNITNVSFAVYPNNLSEAEQNTLKLVKPILFFGDKDNPPKYEKYTSIEPSPSLDYEQPIEVIEEGDYEFTTANKNVYNYINTTLNSHFGLSIERRDNGYFHITGTPEKNYVVVINSININNILSDGETYTLSQNLPAYIYAQIIATPRSSSDTTKYIFSSNSMPKTQESFKVDKSKYSYRLGVQSGLASDLGENIDLLLRFQLERGSEATEFEPHRESKLPFTIPEDEFFANPPEMKGDELITAYNEDDKHSHLYLEKNIGRILIKSSDIPSFDETYQRVNVSVPTFNNKPLSASYLSDTLVKSNIAIQKINTTVSAVHLNNIVSRPRPNGGISLYFWLEDVTNLENARKYFDNHNVYAYFELADEDKYVIDLGIKDMPLTFFKETNLFNNFPLPVTTKLYYYRDFKGTIEQLQIGWQTAQQDILKLQADVSTLKEQLVTIMSSIQTTNEEVIEDDLREE